LDSDDHKGDKIMSQKKTKGALFVEKLKGDEKLQAEMKNDPGEVLKKFGFDVEDLPAEVAAVFTGGGVADRIAAPQLIIDDLKGGFDELSTDNYQC